MSALDRLLEKYVVESFLVNKGGAWFYRVLRRERGAVNADDTDSGFLMRVFSPALGQMNEDRFESAHADHGVELEHPCLTRLWEVGEYPDPVKRRFLFYSVEDFYAPEHLLSGRDAGDGGLDIQRAIGIGRDLANAIAYLEQRDAYHGGIKPGNILVGEQRCRLLHPVIARLTNVERERSEHERPTLANICRAPELGTGDSEPSIRTDIYAIGAILFFITTGRLPTQEGAAQSGLSAPDPRPLREDLPNDLVAIIVHAMQVDPQARYATAADLAADLRAVAADGRPEHALPAVAHLLRRTTTRVAKNGTGKQERPTTRTQRRVDADRPTTRRHGMSNKPDSLAQRIQKRPVPWIIGAGAGVLLLFIAVLIGLVMGPGQTGVESESGTETQTQTQTTESKQPGQHQAKQASGQAERTTIAKAPEPQDKHGTQPTHKEPDLSAQTKTNATAVQQQSGQVSQQASSSKTTAGTTQTSPPTAAGTPGDQQAGVTQVTDSENQAAAQSKPQTPADALATVDKADPNNATAGDVHAERGFTLPDEEGSAGAGNEQISKVQPEPVPEAKPSNLPLPAVKLPPLGSFVLRDRLGINFGVSKEPATAGNWHSLSQLAQRGLRVHGSPVMQSDSYNGTLQSIPPGHLEKVLRKRVKVDGNFLHISLPVIDGYYLVSYRHVEAVDRRHALPALQLEGAPARLKQGSFSDLRKKLPSGGHRNLTCEPVAVTDGRLDIRFQRQGNSMSLYGLAISRCVDESVGSLMHSTLNEFNPHNPSQWAMRGAQNLATNQGMVLTSDSLGAPPVDMLWFQRDAATGQLRSLHRHVPAETVPEQAVAVMAEGPHMRNHVGLLAQDGQAQSFQLTMQAGVELVCGFRLPLSSGVFDLRNLRLQADTALAGAWQVTVRDTAGQTVWQDAAVPPVALALGPHSRHALVTIAVKRIAATPGSCQLAFDLFRQATPRPSDVQVAWNEKRIRQSKRGKGYQVVLTATAVSPDGEDAPLKKLEMIANDTVVAEFSDMEAMRSIQSKWSDVQEGIYFLKFAFTDTEGKVGETKPLKYVVGNPPRRAVLVVGKTGPSANDRLLQSSAQEKLGLQLTVQRADSFSLKKLPVGTELCLLSDSIAEKDLKAAVHGVKVPVLTWNTALYQRLGLTRSGTNQVGQVPDLSTVKKVSGGNLRIYRKPAGMAWGRPSGGTKALIVAGDQAVMLVLAAAARDGAGRVASHPRVAIGFMGNAGELSSGGWGVITATIDDLLGR